MVDRFRGAFTATLRLLWAYFGHFGVKLGSLWGHIGHIRVTLERYVSHVEPYVSHFEYYVRLSTLMRAISSLI